METHQGRILIIVAGYPIEMKSFVEQNPGLLSRFSPEIHFKDFSIDELIQVFLKSIESEGLIINQANLIKVRKFIEYARLREKRMFGNARFVLNLVEIVKINLAKRVIPTLDVTHENEKILLLTTIESEDIPEPESYMSQDS